MPALGLDHYNLRAPRAVLDRLRDFYCTAVGLAEGYRPPLKTFGYWLYAGDIDVLHLSESYAAELRNMGISTTFDHVAFACSDIESMQATLKKVGIDYQLKEVPLAGVRQIFFRDPAGNGIELNFDVTAVSP